MDTYYNNIKELLINNEVTKRVKTYSINKNDLETKYEVGKLLSEAGKQYGEGIIKKYSVKLTQELGCGYSERNLRNIRQYYIVLSNNLKWQTLSAKLSFSHFLEIIWLKDINILNYYFDLCINNNLSVRELRNRIKSKEYERLSIETRNKLINKDNLDIKETIPEPIVIKINSDIDKEHIGQIMTYVNYIDKNVKTIYQNKTIGIILVKRNNKLILEYSTDKSIICREYELTGGING